MPTLILPELVSPPAPAEEQVLSLTQIEQYAGQMLEVQALAPLGWTFAWDHARTRFGACRYRSKQITLSRPIFAIEANRSQAVDTVLHEVAHALAGAKASHGPIWRLHAVALGAAPKPCARIEVAPERPVVGLCRCGPIHRRYRMPTKRHLHTMCCTRCHLIVYWSRPTELSADDQIASSDQPAAGGRKTFI